MKTLINTQSIRQSMLALFLISASFLITGKASGCTANYSYATYSAGLLRTSNSSTSTYGFTSSWSFGDGYYSTSKSPDHTYAKNGKYIVCLTITDTLSKCTSTKCDTIGITSACTATANFDYHASLLAVSFNDSGSTGLSYPHSTTWTFGDSHTGSGDKPTHTYASSGTYQVCETVYDSVTTCTASYCQSLTVSNCTLTASFTDSIVGHKVYFTGKTNSTTSHKSIKWYFGDNGVDSTSGLKTSHSYSTSLASAIVYLRIYDSTTKCLVYSSQTVTFCTVSSDFSTSISGPTVTLKSDSNKATVKYSWDFNDKTSSHIKNPTHSYSTSGTYNICLTATDTVSGCYTTTCHSVTINICTLTASFKDSVVGNKVYFTGTTNASSVRSITWEFGDGTSDNTSGLTTTHTYASSVSTESVYLRIYDSTTKCLYYATGTVTICTANSSFSYTTNLGTVTLKSDSGANKATVKYSWDFNDKTGSTAKNPVHTYAASGTYNICLTATDSVSKCSTTTCHSITINTCTLTGSFRDSVVGNKVFFTGTTNASAHRSITWEFGDGTSDNTSGLTTTHTYASSVSTEGVYLRIYDSTTKCLYYATGTVTICTANSSFSYTTNGGTVTLKSDSGANKATVRYSWDFNDKTGSTAKNPVHTYATSGTYNICLTTTDSVSKCSTTTCHSITINTCTITAAFTDSVVGRKVYFTGKTNSTTPHKSIKWYFGDNGVDSTSGLSTSHTYASSVNSAIVYLRIYDSTTKCLVYASQTITFCTISSYFSTIVNGMTVSAKSDSTNKATVKYVWDFNDKTSSHDKNPNHTYAANGTYNICLTTTDTVSGCYSTTCHSITINTCTLTASFIDSVNGHLVKFFGTTNASSHSSIRWIFGDNTSDSASGLDTHHTYSSSLTSVSVYLRIYDSVTKCLYYTSKTITLSNCSLSAAFTYSISGHKVTFTGKSNATPHHSSIKWYFGDNGVDSTSGLSTTHTYSSSATTEYVYLRVYDSTTKCLTYATETISFCHVSAHFVYGVSGKTIKVVPDSTNASSVTYRWAFGDGTYSTDKSPSHTYSAAGAYHVCLYAIDSPCTESYCDSVVISSSTATYCIHGTVTTGKRSGYPCEVYLITYNPTDSSLSAIDSVAITDTSGVYEFCGLKNGTYYTKAALLKGNPYYSYFIPTYHNDATKWATAVSITINGANVTGADIKMKLGTNPGGAGFIGGKIKAGANKTGDPEQNVLVILYDAGSNPVAYTYSDVNGEYSFAGIAFGSYTVEGEIPGKVCYPASVTVSDTDATNDNVNLKVNLTTVTPDVSTSGIKPISAWILENANIYPNPVSDKLTIATNLQTTQPVNIQIMDVTGKVLIELHQDISGGKQTTQIDATPLPSGMYFIKLQLLKDSKILEGRFVKVQ